MTIVDHGDGRHTVTLSAPEQAMLVRAEARYGPNALREELGGWLRRSGGIQAEMADLRDAFMAADPQTRAAALELLKGLEP